MTARRRLRIALRLLAVVALLGAVTATSAVWTNAFGAGDRFERLVVRVERFLAGPPPDREIRPIVAVTPRPVLPTPGPTPTPLPPASGNPSPTPGPTPTPTPIRAPVDVSIVADPDATFASQGRKDWCAPAGIQMVLAALDLADTSAEFQQSLAGRIREWESRADSLDGGWGPSAMVDALIAYGAHGYEIRAYETREDALRDAAAALTVTRSPVLLLAWRGAHTWVMTGYRADADPTAFGDAVVEGTYILDPWYPRISSIWGPSDPPGTYQDRAEMERNYLPWKRPEGRYPDRDGRFLAIVPTIPATTAVP